MRVLCGTRVAFLSFGTREYTASLRMNSSSMTYVSGYVAFRGLQQLEPIRDRVPADGVRALGGEDSSRSRGQVSGQTSLQDQDHRQGAGRQHILQAGPVGKVSSNNIYWRHSWIDQLQDSFSLTRRYVKPNNDHIYEQHVWNPETKYEMTNPKPPRPGICFVVENSPVEQVKLRLTTTSRT